MIAKFAPLVSFAMKALPVVQHVQLDNVLVHVEAAQLVLLLINLDPLHLQHAASVPRVDMLLLICLPPVLYALAALSPLLMAYPFVQLAVQALMLQQIELNVLHVKSANSMI